MKVSGSATKPPGKKGVEPHDHLIENSQGRPHRMATVQSQCHFKYLTIQLRASLSFSSSRLGTVKLTDLAPNQRLGHSLSC